MCGILGFTKENKPALRRMLRSLAHRGPDDEGIWTDGSVSLGHARLAIIDLTAAGHQPMRRGTLLITFNGEIFNYRELRVALEAEGRRFQTQSDTEVILAAYEEWGDKCVEKFNGQFAFCIYDTAQKRLFLARDPFGQKPLYYTTHDGNFIFASEIKALLAYTQEYKLNPDFVPYLLSYRYVPSSIPVFQNIRKLGAGCTASYNLRTKLFSTKRYWSLQYEPKQHLTLTQAAHELRKRMEEAVKYTLVADVPVGIFLSGGVDSSIVTYHASKLSPHIKTFTIGSRDQAHDESKYAQIVADTYGTDHRTFYIKDREFVQGLKEMYRHYDTPYLSTSSVTLYTLARRARKHVTVALSGEGGDEHFAGYTRTSWFKKHSYVPKFARPIVKAAAAVTGALKPTLKDRARAAANAVGETDAQRYATIANPIEPEIQALAPLGEEKLYSQYQNYFTHKDKIDSALSADVQIYLESDLLLKLDTSTMAHALEGRLPFLDPKLSQWIATLPTNLKLRGNKRKVLLTQSYKDVLPKQILARPKSGFGLPLSEFMQGDGKNLVLESLQNDAAILREGLIDVKVAKRAIESFAINGTQSQVVYTLLHLEQFLQSLPEKIR